MKNRIIIFALVFVLAGIGTCFSYKINEGIQKAKAQKILLAKRKKAWANLEKSIKSRVKKFKGTVGLEIKDLDKNWEISINKKTLMPSASLVKIPIMMACFYAAQDSKISLKDRVRLKASKIVGGSKVLSKEPDGKLFSVDELFSPMITESDNSASNLLIEFMGFDTLGVYFKKMSLKNTNISRRMMDFQEREDGVENYTTAEDMAFLLEKLYRRSFLNKSVSERCLALLGEQKINDRIPKMLPKEGTFIAHKTGLERSVCHDVGIVFTGKGDFLICVMVRHKNKYAQPAKKLIADIALLTYNYYQDSG